MFSKKLIIIFSLWIFISKILSPASQKIKHCVIIKELKLCVVRYAICARQNLECILRNKKVYQDHIINELCYFESHAYVNIWTLLKLLIEKLFDFFFYIGSRELSY